MKRLSFLSAVIACGGGALVMGDAVAATVGITGKPYSPQYGSAQEKNNVIGFDPSGFFDAPPSYQKPWRAGGFVYSTLDEYAVDWYFSGAESGDAIGFHAESLDSMDVNFTEHDEVNLYKSNGLTWKSFGTDGLLGTTTGSGDGDPATKDRIDFVLTDTTRGGGVTNGVNNSKPSAWNNNPSLIFAFVDPTVDGGVLKGWTFSLDASDWFVFAFDDPGSKDNDHDDYIGVAHVYALRPVPVPAALPLMGSLLGGGYLLRKWRKSRARRGTGLST
jgi:hypothetical protein